MQRTQQYTLTLTYIAKVVVRNEDDVVMLKELLFDIPTQVRVMEECGSGYSTTVMEEHGGALGGCSTEVKCFIPLPLPPNEEVRLPGGYSLANDILLRREGFMRARWSISYYIPSGSGAHTVLSGHVIAVVRASGRAYGGGGSFAAAVAVNATLTEAPDGSHYYVGLYGHIIAGSDEVSRVFSIGER